MYTQFNESLLSRHCHNSMRNKVYATVGRPSVRPSVCLSVVPARPPLLWVCCCGPDSQKMSIELPRF